MTDEPDKPEIDPELSALWQAQPKETEAMSLAQVQVRALQFQNRIRLQNIWALIGVVLGVALSAWVIITRNDPYLKGGYLLSMLAMLFILARRWRDYQVDRKAVESPSQACLDFHMQALRARIRVNRTAWAWGLLPIIPGMGLIFYRVHMLLGHPHSDVSPARLEAAMLRLHILDGVAVAALILLPIYYEWRARALTRELNVLEGVDHRIEAGKPGKWNSLFFPPSNKTGQAPFRKLDPIRPPSVFNMKMAIIVFVIVAGLLVLMLVPLMAGGRH